jgi:hypothetical protein
MQYGKSVVKTRAGKYHLEDFERKPEKTPHKPKMKHHDKALLRSKREEEREDFGGYHIDEGY